MTIDKIRELVEHETGYDLTNTKRTTEYVYMRAMYYKLCREYTLHSLNTIGKSVGKNHATVLHGLKLFDNWIDKHEKSYIDTYSKLDKIIASKLNRERKYRDKEYYRNKYAKTLIKLRDVENKHRNLLKLINV